MATLMKRGTLRELRRSVSVALAARKRVDAALDAYATCHWRMNSALYEAARESDTLETAYYSTKRSQLNERHEIEAGSRVSDSLAQLADVLGREGGR